MDPKKTNVGTCRERAREGSFNMPTISVEEAPTSSHIFQFSPNSSVSRKQYKEDNKKALFVGEEQEPETFDPLSPSKDDEQSTILQRRMTVPACINTFRRALSEEAKIEEVKVEELERRLRTLAEAFSARTKRAKAKLEEPPTPSSSDSETDESMGGEANLLDRLRMLSSPGGSEFGGDRRRKSLSQKVKGSFIRQMRVLVNFLRCNYTMDADGKVYVGWLCLVAVCFVYNALVVPLRAIFPYQTKDNVHIWEYLDYFADAVYFVDIIAFKSHRKFIKEGFWIKESSETRKYYFKTLQFKIDVAALCPADIIVALVYDNYPLLRVPRLLKVETYWELFQRFDTILASPHAARITRTMLYMMYMIHFNSCAYYGLSKWEGIGTTTWTFDGAGNAYIRCFYFATKTATSIGKNPKPENEMEYIYMTFAWLSGVFVFAILIGQIRDIIATATKNQEEYRASTYAAMSYLHRLGVPKSLQNKVSLWLSYTWEQQKTLDESKILDLLPHKMRTDVALNLHVETVSKVKLFQNCEVAFLRDLVVKLRSIIFLPGDFVCRKGEVGREMFIVKSGIIHVIGGASGSQILATLREGSVFGEIALLGIGGMNKRTADVRAAGFANLFVLHKFDLEEAIRDYPASQEIMKKKAKKLMKENLKKAKAAAASSLKESRVASGISHDSVSEFGEVIIQNKPEPLKLIEAMMQIFPPESKIGRYLAVGSKATSEIDIWEKSIETMTSYPPSPFLPFSPSHISLELDISIMTGDSSEKQFSPPPSSKSSHKSLEDTQFQRASKTQKLEDESKSCSWSCSSGDELRAYLEPEEFDNPQEEDDANKLKENTRCRTPIPPMSPVSNNNEVENLETRENAAESSNTTRTFMVPTTTTGIRNRMASSRLSVHQMELVDCENEDTTKKIRSSSVSDIVKPSCSREILPVGQRPPMYPIVLGDFPGASLSSSEESEEHDGSAGSKSKAKREMTPRAAAIIASRFLTRVKPKTPLKRQPGVDRRPSGEYVEQSRESTLDFDTD